MKAIRPYPFLFVFIFSLLFHLIWPLGAIQSIRQTRFSVVAQFGIEEARSEEEKPYQFASILSVDCDAEGNIYVLDYKDVCVKVFDKAGRFLRILSGPGQGPNEIENPYRIKIHKTRKHIFVLHKNGFQIKELDDSGNFVRSYSLPEQIFGYHDFINENHLLFVASAKYGVTKFNNLKIFDLETHKIERKFAPTVRDYFTSFQRFVVKDGIIWTCPGDFMELEAYDLKTGAKRKTIALPEKYVPFCVLKWQREGQGIQKLRLSNYAQPFLVGPDLFVFATRQQFVPEVPDAPEYTDRPIKRSSKVYKLENDHLIEVTGFPSFNFYVDFLASWENRILVSSSFYDAFPQVVVLEVQNLVSPGPRG